MADSHHFEKSKNGHISAIVWPFSIKFGTVMDIGLLNRIGG